MNPKDLKTIDASSLATTSAELPSEPAPQKPASTNLRIDRYLLLRAIGEGGMGVVYAAYDEELDRKVAVKLIHPSKQGDTLLRTRILREAQALARVSVPNVVTVYQAGEVDGRLFIAMEFVNGTTLTKWQAEPGRSWQEILRMYIAAGQGLLGFSRHIRQALSTATSNLTMCSSAKTAGRGSLTSAWRASKTRQAAATSGSAYRCRPWAEGRWKNPCSRP
jgi:hypothetical protein